MNDNRASLLDLGITVISSDTRSYTIDSLIGRGGSSLVYKAYHLLNGYYKIVLIKELLPLELCLRGKISRDEKGNVLVLGDSVDQYDRYILVAETEQNTINELRFVEDQKNNEPYFFDQVDCFRANNTLYSVLETESGDTLLSLLHEKETKNEKKWPEDLRDVCQIVLRILEALEPIHSRGRVHLDVSPDNIFFSKMAVNDNRVARMIDFNSVFDLNDAEKDQNRFSYKEGYSAPELSGMTGVGAKKISYSTDLYSVAAVMFRILKGAPTSSFSMHHAECWEVDEDNPYCRSVPESAIDMCNKILRKGLSPMQKRRYQTIAEMRCDIKDLYELCVQTPYLIKSNVDFSMLPTNIYGREEASLRIEHDLGTVGRVILSGIGGMGKTTLALGYAREHVKEYNKIIFLHFYRSVMETITDDSIFPIYGISRVNGERDEDYYKRKLAAFGKIADESVLLILDGFDEIDDELSGLLTIPCRIIVTSRIDYSLYGVNDLEVGSLDNEAALTMFRRISGVSEDDEDDESVLRLLGLIGYHTLTVELLARQVAFGGTAVDELIKTLNDRGLVELDSEKVGSAKDRKLTFESVIDHIVRLFSLDTLSSDERHLIYKMALFSDIGVPKEAFNNFNGSSVDSDMDRLVTLGWVQYSSDQEEYKMHPVTAEAAVKRNESEKYYFDDFVDKCNSWMVRQFGWEQWIVDKKMKLQDQLIKKYNYHSLELKMKVLVDSLSLSIRVNMAIKTSDYIILALKLLQDNLSAFPDGLCALLFNNVGLAKMTNGDYDQALEHFDAAEKFMADELSESKYFKDPDIARETYVFMLCNIADLMIATEDYDKALDYLSKGLDVAENFNKASTEARCTALLFQKTATLFYRQGRKEEAFEYLEQSQKSAIIDLRDSAEIYLSDLCLMSDVLCDLNEFEAAERIAELAVSAVDILIDNDSGRIKAYEALAHVYFKRKEYEKAYEEYEKAFGLIKSSDFYSATFLIRFYNDFACVCEKLKDLKRSAKLMWHALFSMYGTDYTGLSSDELISKTRELLIKYKSIGICNVFINVIKYHLAIRDNLTSDTFYLLLSINREYLDHYTKTWIEYYRDHYYKSDET